MGITTPKLGQHFLNDRAVIEKIIETANLNVQDFVLEIGPGRGVLTSALLKKAGKVLAVEKDGELFANLKKSFSGNSKLELINSDIRDLNLGGLPKKYKLVANIPYYLTGQIVRDFLSAENPPRLSVLMVQKEVAQRLTAARGQGSLLQISAQVFSDIEIAAIVPKNKFSPPPKVDSAVVKLVRKEKPELSPAEQKDFFRILKFAFSGKRKKLVNSLCAGLKAEKGRLKSVLALCGIAENSRPQELDLNTWVRFYWGLISTRLL